MNKETKQTKSPATPEKIFKIMMTVTYVVAAAFFLTNITGGNVMGAITIAVCMFLFSVVVVFMRKRNLPMVKQQLILSLGLVFLVFVISMNSGSYYSDDFPLFLAVIALSGMYLEPSYTIWQVILSTICLGILYVVHPEKADPLSQYLMCVGLFDIAAWMMYMLIRRGRAFIEIGNQRAEEAERLIEAINATGIKLQENCEASSDRINGMQAINDSLSGNVEELKKGSDEITQGTKDVDIACDNVLQCMKITEEHVGALNAEVKKVEDVLALNKQNVGAMDAQMQKVKSEVNDVNQVFDLLQQQIDEIAGVTEQLTAIATSTKMLALNASIEAARAGQSGAGFAVVASKVQDLALDSNKCSDQVVEIVGRMKNQIDATRNQITESTQAIESSIDTLDGLEQGFDGLITQFGSLYGNIEEQNKSIQDVDEIFAQLRDRVLSMAAYAEENEAAVETIVDATLAYRDYVDKIIGDTKQIHELSNEMMDSAQ